MRPALLLLLTAGCLDTAKVIDDRGAYLDAFAVVVCDEADRCGNVGEGQDYESMDDCHDEVESTMRDWWPEDECGGGRINGDAFETCTQRAEVLACDATVFDWIATASDCDAGSVCTDPE